MIAWIIGITLVLISLAVSVRTLREARLSVQHSRSLEDTQRNEEPPPVSIIKPVYGADSFSAANFRSWSNQKYEAAVQLIYSFQDANDAAVPIAKAAAGPHKSTIVSNPVLHGYSGKVSNQVHGLRIAEYDFLVFCDSDIRANPYLCRQLADMHAKGVDLISCLMRHVDSRNVWGRVYASFWNFEHMAFIAPGIRKKGIGATGGVFALTRKTLEQIGGLVEFKDYVAEDVAMGRAAHEAGLKVGLGPIVDSPVDKMAAKELLNKFSRAALFGISMGNMSKSLQYATLFSYILMLGIGGILGNSTLLLAGLAAAVIRFICASVFWSRTQSRKKIFWEIYLSDVIFLLAYFRAMFTRSLVWGAHRYKVQKDGRMVKVR